MFSDFFAFDAEISRTLNTTYWLKTMATFKMLSRQVTSPKLFQTIRLKDDFKGISNNT